MIDLQTLLEQAHGLGASELVLAVGAPPLARVGELVPLTAAAEISASTLGAMLGELLSERDLAELPARRSLATSVTLASGMRVRALCSISHAGLSATLRLMQSAPPSVEDLGLPPAVEGLLKLDSGLVVVCGTKASGKSTTLGALVRALAEHAGRHIVTLEQPIEHTPIGQKSVLSQREVGGHCESFVQGIEGALHLDADALVISDLDAEGALEAALDAASSGVFVLGESTAKGTTKLVERFVSQCAAAPSKSLASHRLGQLADALSAVLYQELFDKRDGGRVAAFELLVHTPELANAVRDANTSGLAAILSSGRAHGAQTLDASLLELAESDIIEGSAAFARAIDKKAFARFAPT